MLLIKNGTVYTMTSSTPIKTDILVEEGKIKQLSPNIDADCQIIDACGMLVYPGIIEAHSHLGIHEAGIGFEGNDTNEMSEPITPQVRAIDGIHITDETVKVANAHGITTVCCAPGSANVVGGQACIYKTVGTSIDDAVINPYYAMKCAYGENPKRVYSDSKIKTRMGTAALIRELLFEAKQYMQQKEAAKDDLSKLPKFNMKLEAMIPVLKREVPLKAHAHRMDDILTSIRIANEFNLDMTLDHCTEGHLIPDAVKASGFSAIVGPSLTHKSKYELSNKTFKTPALLNKAGILIALTTDSPVVPQEFLPICAGLAVKSGLDHFEALKAITINAAKILKIDHRIGSIEVGKDADFVITDACIMEISSTVAYTIIDGVVTYQKA